MNDLQEFDLQVLEFKHHAPFDGCHHQWQYILIDRELGIYPVVFTDGHGSASEVVDHYLDDDAPWYFTDFRLYDWPQGPDDELMRELPFGWYPHFWKAAEEIGDTVYPRTIGFPWTCADCEQVIGMEEPPTEMSGYRGIGGMAIEPDGWLCLACSRVPEEDV